MKRLLTLTLLLASAFLSAGNFTEAQVGNNGTVKIHDAATGQEFRQNEPHVCAFYLAGFGFDNSQNGTFEIRQHAPTGSAGAVAGVWGPANAQGDWRTATINIPNGHYKLTISAGAVEPKHKVFWVECGGTGVVTPSPGPTGAVPTSSPTPGVTPPGTPGATSTPTPPTGVSSPTAPPTVPQGIVRTLPNTSTR